MCVEKIQVWISKEFKPPEKTYNPTLDIPEHLSEQITYLQAPLDVYYLKGHKHNLSKATTRKTLRNGTVSKTEWNDTANPEPSKKVSEEHITNCHFPPVWYLSVCNEWWRYFQWPYESLGDSCSQRMNRWAIRWKKKLFVQFDWVDRYNRKSLPVCNQFTSEWTRAVHIFSAVLFAGPFLYYRWHTI